MGAITTIDKVSLEIPSFVINDIDNIMIGQSYYPKLQGQQQREVLLLTDANGTDCFAKSIYFNSTLFQFDITRSQHDGKTRGYVTYNPKRFNYDLDLAVKTITADLQEFGIELTNFSDAKLNRTDLAGDDKMVHQVPEYNDAIEMLMKARYHQDRTIYPHSMLYKKTAWQLCNYDKGLKNIIDEGEKNNHYSTNLLRNELRLMSSRSIQNHMGIVTHSDLMNLTHQELHKKRVEITNKFINQSITNYQPSFDIQTDFDAFKEINNKARNKQHKALMFMALFNQSNDILIIKHQYEKCIRLMADQRQYKSRSNKSHWISSEMKAFDTIAMAVSLLMNHRTKQATRLLINKVEEYKEKFLTA